jgi:hypothetical protein
VAWYIITPLEGSDPTFKCVEIVQPVMSGFGERTPEETGEGFGEWVACPECEEEGREHTVRSHLLNDHDWSQNKVDEHFGEHPFEIVDGASPPPVPERERTPSYATSSEERSSSKEGEVEEAEDESDLCDCDPKHKETQVIQKSKSGRLGPLGGGSGDGTPVIICKNCGGKFEAKEDDGGFGPGLVWDGDGPGPF